MSIVTDSMGQGGGVSRFDSFHGRTPGGQFHGSLRYPSPFFDIGHTFLPSTFDQLFKWCRYYFLVNPLINAVTYKMAEYPITPLIFEVEDVDTRKKWEGISENMLRLRAFQIEVGLDYFCYGNAFITLHFPFIKYLICTNCKHEVVVDKAAYKFRNLKFYLACDKCDTTSEAKVHDHYIKDLKGIKLIRWNPEYVRPEHNELTGHTDFFLQVPQVIKNDILLGKRHIVETIPHIYIEALQQSKSLRFTDDSVFHLKRPTIAQKDMGWGMPLILPVLKDTYYLQILRKAQEAIAQQHIVPLRILFPQAAGASSDPYSTTDLGMWRKRIEAEIAKWRADANYIPILPLPIGNETIGGEGKALMLHQEMRAWSEQIVAGMHVPIEFVFGGLQYCQAPDTLLFTSRGLETLEEITPFSEGRGTTDRRIVSHEGVKNVLVTHHVGNKRVATLHSRLGLDLVAAHTHPILVLNQDLTTSFKTMEEIRPGDRIAVKVGAELWPVETTKIDFKTKNTEARFESVTFPTEATPELARLLGYLVSEGSCVEDHRMGFGNTDQEVNADFAACCQAVFGYTPTFWSNKNQKKGKPFFQTEISKRQAVEFLQSLGINGYAEDKTVPAIIRYAPRNLVAEFLRAYFEGDGGVEDVEEKQSCYAASKSGRLLQEVQLLLLNMGIVSSRYRPYEGHSCYALQIRSHYVDRYATEVGFISSRKLSTIGRRTPSRTAGNLSSEIPFLKERLNEFRDRHFHNRSSWKFEPLDVALPEGKENFSVDEVATLVSRERSTIFLHIKSGALKATKAASVGGKFSGYIIQKTDLEYFLRHHGLGRHRNAPKSFWVMSYEKLSSKDISFIREREPDLAKRIDSLVESHFIWDEVQEIELLDIEIPMRDLTVADAHTYQGNGIISHNSGSNVSMRMLENQFLGYRLMQHVLVNDFVLGRIADYMGWPRPQTRFKRFKMADDLQRSALVFQLNQAMKISDTTLLDDMDYDIVQEEKFKYVELGKQMANQRRMQLAAAALQGEVAVVSAKYQVLAQKLMQELGIDPAQAQGGGQSQQPPQVQPPGQEAPQDPYTAAMKQFTEGEMQNMPNVDQILGRGDGSQQPKSGNDVAPGVPAETTIYPENANEAPREGIPPEMQSPLSMAQASAQGYNLLYVARSISTDLEKMDELTRQSRLQDMRGQNPQLYSVVQQLLSSSRGSQVNPLNPLQSPLPQQKPPRRQDVVG